MRLLFFMMILFLGMPSMAKDVTDIRTYGQEAPTKIYLFTSLACPHCADFHKNILPDIQKEYLDTHLGQVVIVDMLMNKQNLMGAMLLRCASKDAVDKIEDNLYSNQKKWVYRDEDQAIIAGLAHFHEQTVVVIGHEKGNSTETRLKHNFGMARPEGYRKAIRLMKLAEQFGFPVLTFIDTAGAFPGVDAEARGQGQAIASCIATQVGLKVPIIATIIGEGGSGGALALAVGNKVLMLENAIYSVISPEGCASILWKDFKYAKQATRVLKMTAKDLLRLKVIDEIIPESLGGAHRFKKETFKAVDEAILNALNELKTSNGDALILQRQNKFLQMGTPLLNKKKA